MKRLFLIASVSLLTACNSASEHPDLGTERKWMIEGSTKYVSVERYIDKEWGVGCYIVGMHKGISCVNLRQ